MSVTFCTGLMGAGKSKTLIEDLTANKKSKVAFSVDLSKKTGEIGTIESRNGYKIPSICLNNKDEKGLIDIVRTYIFMRNINDIYIDESQFLSKSSVLYLMFLSIRYNVPIHFYGLDLTFTGDQFESSKVLLKSLPNENIKRIEKICDKDRCNEVAKFNARIINGQIVRSGNTFLEEKSLYLALCEKHYFE